MPPLEDIFAAQRRAVASKTVDETRCRVPLLTFRHGGARYAVRLEDLREIVDAVDLTPFPRPVRGLCGILNLRGALLPVIRMSFLREIGVEVGSSAAVEPAGRLAVLELPDGSPVGLRVAEVKRAHVEVDDPSSVRGLIPIDEEPVLLIDLSQADVSRLNWGERDVA